jgi:uncharacterized Zn finger protein (UPF0148 family)
VNPIQVSCPACGGPISFKIGSSLVTVCPYCRSVVARGDRQLEDLGKVADLVETGSVLQVGLKGRYRGVPFELTGRAQLGHPAGGTWDEWYAAFADGRWGWLAEAQGRYYLTFRQQAADPNGVPPFEKLHIGQAVGPLSGRLVLTVAEKAQANTQSAEGEIPYRLEPGQTYNYVDLSGPAGEFGTLDYSEEPPLVFLGWELALDDLGIPETAQPGPEKTRRVEGIQVACPQCGGPLELRAPDRTERVGCPNCGALLDARQGQLHFLEALKAKVKPALPLGAVGRFEKYELTIIGFLIRSVVIEEVKYRWEEYLLYHPRLGFRWLVHSDRHWNYVHAVPPGSVKVLGKVANYRDKQFKLFQKATARVEHVLGECYWKVTVGEEVAADDFVHPPEMLSREVMWQDGQEEINWSLGQYVPVADIEKAFGVTGLARPFTIAPNQPFLYKSIYLSWAALSAIAFVVGLFFLIIHPARKVYEKTIALKPALVQVFFSDPFPLVGHEYVTVSAQAEVDNSWVDLDGDLVNEQTNLVQPFSLPIEYYHGYDGGEHWSEGGQVNKVHLPAHPAGSYLLRLEISRDKVDRPRWVHVRVDQGGGRLLYWFLTFLALSVVPGSVLAYHIYFEQQRWKDSNVA